MRDYRNKRIVLAMSGGLDSSVLARWLMSRGAYVFGMNIFYGSKHNVWEHAAFEIVCQYYHIKNKTVKIPDFGLLAKSNLMQSGGEIPHEYYTHESMKQTVVPGRNMMFISLLLSYALSNEFNGIALSVHQGDHYIYPDCRPNFIHAMQEACLEASENRVTLISPFIEKNKAEIVKIGQELRFPFELTRTCYEDSDTACGECGACRERLEAFEKNGIKDPILYKQYT